MIIFILSVTVVLVVSALCSLSEAAIYAVRLPFVRRLSATGSRAGAILTDFKQNMELPIAAILIINTAANTAGAAVAGAQARLLFGEASLVWFSLFFTLDGRDGGHRRGREEPGVAASPGQIRVRQGRRSHAPRR